MKYYLLSIMMLVEAACSSNKNQNSLIDSTKTVSNRDTVIDSTNKTFIQTKNVQPIQIVDYAETLKGVPYLYASTDPSKGFDCSGFITYVFNHFNIQVPRSSVEFTNVFHEVPLQNAKQGDLILFTGTDSAVRIVGHMGIIISNINDSLAFIHSSSGKANGVTVTPLNNYYMGRFIKIVRVFPQNDSLHI